MNILSSSLAEKLVAPGVWIWVGRMELVRGNIEIFFPLKESGGWCGAKILRAATFKSVESLLQLSGGPGPS